MEVFIIFTEKNKATKYYIRNSPYFYLKKYVCVHIERGKKKVWRTYSKQINWL